MCGIAGILQPRPLTPAIESVLREIGQRIAYRGPDDEQIYRDENI